MLFNRPLPLFAILTVLLTVLNAGFASPAQAALTFCNRTQGPLEAALGRRDGDAWTSQGWWLLEAGQCSKVVGGALADRFYFYFATSLVRPDKDQNPFTWSGKYQFCTSNQPFLIEGDSDCESKGYIVRGFQELDIGANTKNYTLDFKDGSSP